MTLLGNFSRIRPWMHFWSLRLWQCPRSIQFWKPWFRVWQLIQMEFAIDSELFRIQIDRAFKKCGFSYMRSWNLLNPKIMSTIHSLGRHSKTPKRCEIFGTLEKKIHYICKSYQHFALQNWMKSNTKYKINLLGFPFAGDDVFFFPVFILMFSSLNFYIVSKYHTIKVHQSAM